MSADVDKLANGFRSAEDYGKTMFDYDRENRRKRQLSISDKRWVSKRRRRSSGSATQKKNNTLETVAEEPLVEQGAGIFQNAFPKLNGEHATTAPDFDSVVPDLDGTQSARTIYVHETYQLGYVDESRDEKDRLFVFDFVDTLEVGYPVSMSSLDALPIDLPPLFVEAEYVDQLTALANNALEKLADLIESWLLACQNADKQMVIWKHVTAYKQSLSLRSKVVQLLDALIPDLNILEKVDLHSVQTDVFIFHLISMLFADGRPHMSPCKHSQSSPSDLQPCFVSLCSEPAHCVEFLRSTILRLMHILLPDLELPESFDIERDLEALVDATRGCN